MEAKTTYFWVTDIRIRPRISCEQPDPTSS